MSARVSILPPLGLARNESVIEQKFLFEAAKQGLLLDWLEFHLVRDPEFYFSPIITLYYDTPALSLYGEARNGDYLKSKVRLRWYEAAFAADQQTVRCFVEIKLKFGARRQKRRKSLALDPSCLSGDLFSHRTILEAPDVLPEWRLLARGILVPLLTVEYERFRFIEPRSGARIALDRRIGCSRANAAYLAGAVPISLASGVLEVKGASDTLPEFLRPMQRHLRKQSFSKYSRCCDLLIDPCRPGGSA
jgi:VTC domain-containing protein